jgi:hypothetical protein
VAKIITSDSTVITRPRRVIKGLITFQWHPGKHLIELIYTPGKPSGKGLSFAIKDYRNNRLSRAREFTPNGSKQTVANTLKPLFWIEEFAMDGVSIALPSAWEDYKSLDHIAETMRQWIHTYFDCDEVFESIAVLYAISTWVYESLVPCPIYAS